MFLQDLIRRAVDWDLQDLHQFLHLHHLHLHLGAAVQQVNEALKNRRVLMPGQVSPTVIEEVLQKNLQGIRVNLEDLLKIDTPLVLVNVIIKTLGLIEGLEEGTEI